MKNNSGQGHAQSHYDNLPSLSKSQLQSREKDAKPGSSGGFFGQKRSMVASGDGGNMMSFQRGMSKDLSPTSGNKDKSELGQVAPDVLFLKRLLYLKASIDNEPTMSTYAVPF